MSEVVGVERLGPNALKQNVTRPLAWDSTTHGTNIYKMLLLVFPTELVITFLGEQIDGIVAIIESTE